MVASTRHFPTHFGMIATESNRGVTQNFREKSKHDYSNRERKRKQIDKKFRLLNHKVRYICNTFSVEVIRFGRNAEVCRLIFYFFLWACCPNSKYFARKRVEISDSGGGGAAAPSPPGLLRLCFPVPWHFVILSFTVYRVSFN